jgi:hypothetical protein
MSRFARLARMLKRDDRGSSAIEFALSLPILTALGMYGVEIANMQITWMQVSQLAISTADSASRLQQTNNNVVAPTVTEADIDSVMTGIANQGKGIKISDRGRVILSSFEVDPATGKQFIHWQRCTGKKANKKSRYGDEGGNNGLRGAPINGMGRGKTRVTAVPGVAVMFAEVHYEYRGIFGDMLVKGMEFNQEAAFMVRDSRDLRSPNQPGLTGSNGKSKCV